MLKMSLLALFDYFSLAWFLLFHKLFALPSPPLHLIWGSTFLLLKTKKQESVMNESMKALVAETSFCPGSSLLSGRATPSSVLGGKGNKEEMKKVPSFIVMH